jgi:hypothetical protein
MQITHEEARRLIQFKADERLPSASEEALRTHLRDCKDCQRYLESLQETESTLRLTMRKQWSVRPLPLQMDAVYAKVISNPGASIFMPTRKALIGLAVVTFAFIAWQSMSGSLSSYPTVPGTIPFIPTPSTQYTATNTLQNDCKYVQYIIQQGDTLESIAQQFSTSKEAIVSENGLPTNEIHVSQEISIPFCESTPTGTSSAPTFTITPNLEPISTTPG